MLCDTTGLTSHNVCITDVVEQRCLTVVNVTHDSNNRRPWLKRLRCIDIVLHFLLSLVIKKLNFESVVRRDQCDRVLVETLVDGYHQTKAHTLHDDVRCRYAHQVRKVGRRHKLRQAKDRTLTCEFLLTNSLFLLTFHALTLTELCTSTRWVEFHAAQRLPDCACDVGIRHLRTHSLCTGLLFLLVVLLRTTCRSVWSE